MQEFLPIICRCSLGLLGFIKIIRLYKIQLNLCLLFPVMQFLKVLGVVFCVIKNCIMLVVFIGVRLVGYIWQDLLVSLVFGCYLCSVSLIGWRFCLVCLYAIRLVTVNPNFGSYILSVVFAPCLGTKIYSIYYTRLFYECERMDNALLLFL